MSDITELRGGLLVRSEAILLYLALENRQHVLTVHENQLHVSNGSALSSEDRAQIRELKHHLMALAQYRAPEDPQ